MSTATMPTSTATMISPIDQIGEIAARVADLDLHGQMSMAQLIKAIDAPRDVVMQAVGWLAREDKVEIDETPRGRRICLKQC